MGSDVVSAMDLRRADAVSIHTPAWGVTSSAIPSAVPYPVSIHTPAWGVTISKKSGYNGTISFNPHSRVGSDELQERADNLTESFNPHSLVGSDTEKVQTYLRTGSFNPHSRVGSDRLSCPVRKWNIRFNPHSRVGSDQVAEAQLVERFRFQSTLPRGE